MIWKIIAFIIIVLIVMVVTCLLLFRAQFDRLERQVEEEYQKLYPVMEKRRDILASFFSADKVAQWGGEEAFNQSLLNALEELLGDGKDRDVVIKNHVLLTNLLVYEKEDAEEGIKSEQRSQKGQENQNKETLKNTWQKLEGYQRVLAMEENYLHAIEPLQLAIHTYNVLRQVFPASFTARLLKKQPMVELCDKKLSYIAL